MVRSLSPIDVLLAFTALAGMSGTGHAANVNVQVKASASRPLTLSTKQDLDFGQVLISGSGGTVSISTTGARTCPTGLTCTGVARQAILNASGSNGWVVRIQSSPSDLVNSTNGSTIRFVPAAPATVTLTNSGQPGKDFGVGGSITVLPSTSGGTYVGNIQVTVDYP